MSNSRLSEKDRLSISRTLLLQWKPKLGRKKTSTGLHAALGFDMAGLAYLSDTSDHRQLKIPKIWRRPLIVAIPKPEKPLGDPKSYRPISLLVVQFKILERLIYARADPIIDPLLLREQASYRHGRSTVDQVILLTQDIEDSFSATKKAGAVHVDLTAAYDTVWHRGLTCKLLQLLPDRHMVHMIMEMVGNAASPSPPETANEAGYDASRTCPTGICPGAPSLQHLHLWPANHRLQKVCICWRSSNDAHWLRLAGNGRVLSKDMATLGEYLQTWKQKLSTAETVSAAFHLNNKEAKRELKVKYNNETLLFQAKIPWSNVGQVAHVSTTPSVTSQEADITRRAPEAACWLRLGCWRNNSANSHPSPGPFNRRVLRACMVPSH